ncbi:MAG: SDR family oxidoreductase [Acidimicrobiales bacterium]|nr:SDR family oxidoreductase [Acidimicrobiales bacterium]
MARVLITGCSTGFGRATAVELATRGYEVVATARRPETLADVDAAARLALDVTDDASVSAAVAAAGTVDVLVNNAGVGIGGPIELVPMAEVRRVFETNVFGPLRMMQAVLPQMRARGSGTVVNVSSVSGRVSAPLAGFYAATKYALEAMSEALHVEAAHFGIRTIVIEPGFFKTNISESHHDYGVESPPYDELANTMNRLESELGRAAAPGPEVVATAIADAIETPGEVWRFPVGTDAQMVLGARASMDDVTFEKAMREVLNLDW